MNVITSIVLLVMGVYIVEMWRGEIPTDFALFLFVCTVVSGLYFILDWLIFSKQRLRSAQQDVAAFDQINPKPAAGHDAQWQADRSTIWDNAIVRPWWLEYTAGFFPVILSVFVLRSFVVEPFRIPSGSMKPTLEINDLILVNKWQYGIRLPIVNKTLIPIGKPERGDVMVFRYPVDPKIDFIKRVVGLPGDTIHYKNHVLTINGKVVSDIKDGHYYDDSLGETNDSLIEQLGTHRHHVLFAPNDGRPASPRAEHTNPEACVYDQEGGVECKVPANHYFMMGDNRDNSEDSRYWGFVADSNIVGKAFFIWMNFGHINRVGHFD